MITRIVGVLLFGLLATAFLGWLFAEPKGPHC